MYFAPIAERSSSAPIQSRNYFRISTERDLERLQIEKALLGLLVNLEHILRIEDSH